jgi:RHS repeat-associated protein
MTYAYDGNANLLQVVETFSGTMGTRLTSRTYDALDRLLGTTDPDGQTLRYTYDAHGNRLTLIAPDAEVTRSAYDALHRLTSVTTRHGVTEYAYDRASRLTRTTYPSGTQATQAYDAAGRVTRLGHTHQGAPLTTYSYTYDANGNRATQRVTQPVGEEVTTYAYDATDRLREVHYPDITTTYTYDAVGNRLTERTLRPADGQLVADKTYIYNTRQQVIAFTDQQAPAPLTTFTYDATGNRTVQTVDGHTTTYGYDVLRRLRQCTQDGLLVGDFHYDWQGLRIRKATPSEAVRYVYDGLTPVHMTDELTQHVSRYTYGGGHFLAVDDDRDGVQYALADSLGSIMALQRPDGGSQARYQYEAWGQVRTLTGQSTNRLGFTGHEYDVESGLYYVKARYYDPTVGVFLSPDQQLGEPLLPLSLHPYLYAYQNPTVYLDPDGHAAFLSYLMQVAEQARLGTRLEGLARIGYGALEVAGGAAASTVVVGLPLMAFGLDEGLAGVRQVWSGRPTLSLVQQGLVGLGEAVGASQGDMEAAMLLPLVLEGPGGFVSGREALRAPHNWLAKKRASVPPAESPSFTPRVQLTLEEVSLEQIQQAIVEATTSPGTRRQAHPQPANTQDLLQAFGLEDFAEQVAQRRQTTQARYGFTEASEGVVAMAQSPLGPGRMGFTSAEASIVQEANSILVSPEFAKIRAAQQAGQTVEVRIGNRTILFEPDAPVSGMTLFGEEGFIIGREAFTSEEELVKTVLHETYRLQTSQIGASGTGFQEAATAETAAAADFANRAFNVFFQKK